MGTPGCVNKSAEGKRVCSCVVASGASMHMVSEKDLNSAELETMRHRGVRRRWRRPTARCKPEKERRYTSSSWTYSSKLCFLNKTPVVLSLRKLCVDHGFSHHWTSGQKPHLIRNGKRIDCNISNYVPFVGPCLSASSSSTAPSPTSSSSSWQDSVFDAKRYTENPVPERSGSMSGELRRDPAAWIHKKPKNKNKHGESEEVQRDFSHELLDWLQEFGEILVDESTSEPWGNPEQGSPDTSKSSHELPTEPRAKVEPGSGKHSVYLPKDPNCDICLKTKITRASCMSTYHTHI